MSIVKTALELLISCLIYSLAVALIDSVLILLFKQSLDQFLSSVSFVMLVEGGVGLTIGGITAFFSQLTGKIEEVIFHSKPWSADRQKETEKQARTWIVTGSILVIAALLVSAF